MNRRDLLKTIVSVPGVPALSPAVSTHDEIKPGDLVVIELDGLISRDAAERMMAVLQDRIADKAQIVVLDGGAKLRVERGIAKVEPCL